MNFKLDEYREAKHEDFEVDGSRYVKWINEISNDSSKDCYFRKVPGGWVVINFKSLCFVPFPEKYLPVKPPKENNE